MKDWFPSPLEVTGVSYYGLHLVEQNYDHVSVPSRGDWGVLRLATNDTLPCSMFPSPLEVTGVSYKS